MDPQYQGLSKELRKRAKEEVKVALSEALTNLVDELDATERDMELLDEKTGLSGLAAFQRMRKFYTFPFLMRI